MACPSTSGEEKRPIELLFNLDHPDELALVTEVNEDDDEDAELLEGGDAGDTEDELMARFNKRAFLVSTRKLEQLPNWVKVTDVFKSDSDVPFLMRAGVRDLADPRMQKYSQRLARLRGIRKYAYRMDVLERGMKYDEVTEIFVRVNSLGAKLRSSDLALAQITAKWRNSLQLFQDFQAQCAKRGFELDLGLFLKNLMAFATGQSRFLTVGNLPKESLEAAWKESTKGMEFALNFMRSNVGITSPSLLSSPFILIVLAFYGWKRTYSLSADEAADLRFWVLVANAKGRFSRGSSETILDQDLATLRNGGGAKELIDRVRLQFGRLDITPEDLEGRDQRSSLFKTMFLAFNAAQAKDWRSHLRIALDHAGSQHRLQFHHIFPKALLKKSNRNARDADDIANLSFISGKTNRQISDKQPVDYFPEYLANGGHAAFQSQCIPTDESMLAIEAYDDFRKKRRQAIADRLNEFLGTDVRQ